MGYAAYYRPLRITLNLTEEDLGHPEHPDLWEQLRSDRRPVPDRGLLCPECWDNTGCPQDMYVRELPDGRRQAVHNNPNIGEHGPRKPDPKQVAVKEQIADAAERAGFSAELDASIDGTHRRSGVLIRGENKLVLGCEAQLSYITGETVRRRSRQAEDSGVTPLWTTGDKKSPLIDRAPWARFDDELPIELLKLGRPLKVVGGVRALLMLPCDQRADPCPEGRRNCRKWHGQWDVRGLFLPDMIVRAAARELVPLQLPGAKGSRVWFWVSPGDRETYLDSLPGEAEKPTEAPMEADLEPQPTDIRCRYKAPPVIRRLPVRDTGAPIDAPTLSIVKQPKPSRAPQTRPKDACSHWIGREARYCGDLPVRLYIPGRRCSAHTPAALAGELEPGAKPPDQE